MSQKLFREIWIWSTVGSIR